MQVEPGCDASHALTSACLWVDVFVQYRVHSKSLGDLRDAQNRCDPAPAVALDEIPAEVETEPTLQAPMVATVRVAPATADRKRVASSK